MQVRPDWKPAKRKVDKHATRKARNGSCRVCGAHNVSTHHLVPRSLGGDDVPVNLVPLCGHGTAGCHGLVEARDPVACAKLRSLLTADEVAYLLRKKGKDWLDRYYPYEEFYWTAPRFWEVRTALGAPECFERTYEEAKRAMSGIEYSLDTAACCGHHLAPAWVAERLPLEIVEISETEMEERREQYAVLEP